MIGQLFNSMYQYSSLLDVTALVHTPSPMHDAGGVRLAGVALDQGCRVASDNQELSWVVPRGPRGAEASLDLEE